MSFRALWNDLIIVAIGFGIAMFFVWRVAPFGSQPPSRNSRVKLTWFALISCGATLIYLLWTDVRSF